MKNPSLDLEKKCSKNLNEILKGGFEILSTSEKKVVLGQGLLRLVYNPSTDEVESQYIIRGCQSFL